MATRGASTGILVSLAIFALLTLVLFVTTVIFAARSQKLGQEVDDLQQELATAIRPEEQDDRWEELKRQAGPRTGVVRYLDRVNTELTRMIGVSPGAGPDELRQRIAAELELGEDETAPALLRLVDNQSQRIDELGARLDRAQADYAAAVADKEEAIRARQELRAEHRETVDTLTAEIDRTKELAEQYREEVEAAKDRFTDQLAESRSESSQEIASLEQDLQEARDQILVFQNMVENLRGATRQSTLRGRDEATLVDGVVLAVNPDGEEASISLGRRDNVVLGMTFEVYNAGATIRPNAEGDYPRGKASVEVTRVEQGSSRVRIIRINRGVPLIEGDQLVNPVYDPNKTYRFTVFGNFDTNNDGLATAREAEQIRGFIRDWGGEIQDDITGDTDFLVLGQPPILPADPGPDDPIEVIERYLSLKRVAQKYDELFEAAQKTSIPVLNRNRLFTLTGLHAQPYVGP